MAKIEVVGKTIEEARVKAAEQLGINADEVMYEILENAKSGFFGINAKPYKIAAWKEGFEEEAAPVKEEKKEPEKKAKKEVKSEEKVVETKAKDDVSAKEKAENFLGKVLPLMGVEANIDTKETEDGIAINLSGDGMGLVIGRRGETLDAVQYLTSIIVNKGVDGYTKVTVDTENYRQKRAETLERLADKVAEKVIRNGRNMTLEPMNPFERRVIHARLQGNEKVTTISVGEEPNRRVVVKLS